MTHPDPAAAPQWRRMNTDTRARAYSPSTMLPDADIDPYLRAYADQSARAYADLPGLRTLSYGPLASNSIDIVIPPGVANPPLLAFLHGGYWQALGKTDAFFPAPDALARGIAYASIDYTLAPAASLDQIITECTAALIALHRQAADLGIDATRILLAGSSAGAHLAAMAGLAAPRAMLPAGLVLLSGIYDLEPLIGTYINDPLGLDPAAAIRNSPAHADLSVLPASLIAWGGQETDEFKRQSRHFAALLRAAQRPVETLEIPARNHFDIVHDLVNDSQLGRRTAALAAP